MISEVENAVEALEKQEIPEIYKFIVEMDKKELKSYLTMKTFNKFNKMMEEKYSEIECIISLLSCIGYYKVLFGIKNSCFEGSLLYKRIENMILKENNNIIATNEPSLISLCECYLSMCKSHLEMPGILILICVPLILRTAMNKEKNEKIGKEAEMSLVSLSNIKMRFKIEKELYMKDITELIKYHQEHHNLTHLAYQSAWEFLIWQTNEDEKMAHFVENELNFLREAIRELEELEERENWMKRGKFLKEVTDEITLTRWLDTLGYYFFFYEWKEIKSPNFFECIVRILRKVKKYHRKVFKRCVYVISRIANPVSSDISYLLRSGIIRIIMEEMQQPTVRRDYLEWCLKYIISLVKSVDEPSNDANEREKRKMQKHQILDILEEEGYENEIISVYESMVKTFYFYFPIHPADIISLLVQNQNLTFLNDETITGRNNPFEANPFKTGQHSSLQFGAIPPSVNQFLVPSVELNPFATQETANPFVSATDPFASSSNSEKPCCCSFVSAPDPFAQSTGPFAPSTNPFASSASPFAPSTDPFAQSTGPFAQSSQPFSPSTNPFAPNIYPFNPDDIPKNPFVCVYESSKQFIQCANPFDFSIDPFTRNENQSTQAENQCASILNPF